MHVILSDIMRMRKIDNNHTIVERKIMCTGYNKWTEIKKRIADTRVQRISVKKMKTFLLWFWLNDSLLHVYFNCNKSKHPIIKLQ